MMSCSVLVALQDLLHVHGPRVVLFTDDLRVEHDATWNASGSTAG